MATKKQKHAEAVARRQAYLKELEASGQAAIQRDRDYRHKKELDAWRKNHNDNHSWKNRPPECPHCKIALDAAREAKAG